MQGEVVNFIRGKRKTTTLKLERCRIEVECEVEQVSILSILQILNTRGREKSAGTVAQNLRFVVEFVTERHPRRI